MTRFTIMGHDPNLTFDNEVLRRPVGGLIMSGHLCQLGAAADHVRIMKSAPVVAPCQDLKQWRGLSHSCLYLS